MSGSPGTSSAGRRGKRKQSSEPQSTSDGASSARTSNYLVDSKSNRHIRQRLRVPLPGSLENLSSCSC